MKRILFCIALSIVSLSFGEIKPSVSFIQEEKKEGIKVVHNENLDEKKSNKAFELNEDLIIGVEEGDENYMFNYPTDINVDDDGNIYVCDFRDCVIKKYNVNGEFVTNIGGRGQGPGEFTYPSRFCITNNQLIVIDSSRYKLEVFELTGLYLKTIKIGFRADRISKGEGEDPIIGYQYSGDEQYKVGKYSLQETKFHGTIFSKEQFRFKRIMNNDFIYDLPYFVVWDINSNNEVYIGSPDDYLISIYDLSGELKFQFSKATKPVPVVGEELKSIKSTLKNLNLNSNQFTSSKFIYPIFNRIVIDEIDRVWIELYAPNWRKRTRKETKYDVFSADGKFLFSTKFDSHIYPKLVFKNGFIYALKKEESGYSKAVRFKLVEDTK